MSHKVHPTIFRVKGLADWGSRWLDKKRFSKYLEEDFLIREFIEEKLARTGVEKIEIERFTNKINVIILSARPGLIFGRGGAGIEGLKKEIEKKIFKEIKGKIPELKIEVREVKNPWISANLAAQYIAQQIEKRMLYRRVLKQALAKITAYKEVKGVRVEVAGRLDGKEIARTEWLRKGQLPRQTIRADIDYGTAKAYCTYGVVGIKVWIYKGEKF